MKKEDHIGKRCRQSYNSKENTIAEGNLSAPNHNGAKDTPAKKKRILGIKLKKEAAPWGEWKKPRSLISRFGKGE